MGDRWTQEDRYRCLLAFESDVHDVRNRCAKLPWWKRNREYWRQMHQVFVDDYHRQGGKP